MIRQKSNSPLPAAFRAVTCAYSCIQTPLVDVTDKGTDKPLAAILYLNVLTSQITVLSNQQSLVRLQIEQMVAAINLIEALGGGWDPTASQVSQKVSTSDYKEQP